MERRGLEVVVVDAAVDRRVDQILVFMRAFED